MSDININNLMLNTEVKSVDTENKKVKVRTFEMVEADDLDDDAED